MIDVCMAVSSLDCHTSLPGRAGQNLTKRAISIRAQSMLSVQSTVLWWEVQFDIPLCADTAGKTEGVHCACCAVVGVSLHSKLGERPQFFLQCLHMKGYPIGLSDTAL